MTSLYICYEAVDRPHFDDLFRALKDAHYELFESEITESNEHDWQTEMKSRVRDCDQVVLVLGQHFLRSARLRETAVYALKLRRRLAYYENAIQDVEEQLTTWELSRDKVTRIRLKTHSTLGIKGLFSSKGHALNHSRQNIPGDNQKSRWLHYVTHELASRLPGGNLNQTDIIRLANQYLAPHNQYSPTQMHNLFDYRRGTPFPIAQLIAYIRVFQEWIADFSRSDAQEFLRLSGVDEADLRSTWMGRKLSSLFPVYARLNSAFPTMAAAFYGRTTELEDLYERLTTYENKIILLEGMPGIGKTELAKALVLGHRQHFDLIYWYEMRTPLSIEGFIRQFMSFADPAHNGSHNHDGLMEILRTYRCLIVFDQFETVLDRNVHYESYLPIFEDYNHFLRDIATAQGKNVLILTSTHVPVSFAEDIAVRYHRNVERYPINGLDWKYTRTLPEVHQINASDDELKQLTAHFRGHPTAIKNAILKIHEGHYTNVSDYLTYAPKAGDHIKARVSELERTSSMGLEALYWLTIEREYTTLDRLCQLMREPRTSVQQAVQRLTSAYLAERHPADLHTFRVRSDVLDYMTQKLIDRTVRAVLDEDVATLLAHGLKLSGSWDYVYNAQTEMLLKPIVNRLVDKVGEQYTLRMLKNLVVRLQSEEWQGILGYAAANVLNLLSTLGVPFEGMDFSHLCLYEIDLRSIPLTNVNFSGVHFKDCLFDENFASTLCMNFDPSGAWLVVGTSDGRVHLWDTSTCAEVWATPVTQVWVHTVTFDWNGHIVISGDSGGMIRVWDATDGQLLAEYDGQTGGKRLLQMAVGENNRLASVGDDGVIRLWEVHHKSLTPIWKYKPPRQEDSDWYRLYTVALHPDGNLLAAAGESGIIYLCNMEDGHLVDTLIGHDSFIWELAFSPDGRYLASTSEDYTVRIWDVQSRTLKHKLVGHTNTPLSVAFNFDGNLLATGGIDKTIYLWDVQSGLLVKKIIAHYRWIRGVRFQPGPIVNGNQSFLASCGDDRAIKFWDIDRGETVQSWEGIQLAAQALAVSPDGMYLAVSYENRVVQIWDLQGQEVVFSLNGYFNSWVRALAFSPRDPILAIAHENEIILFDSGSGAPLQTIPVYIDQEYVWSLEFSPDGAFLICAGGDTTKTVSFWDTTTWKRYDIENPHHRWIWQARHSTNAGLIATSGDDHSIKLWSAQDHRLLKELPDAHPYSIWMLAFSPDGRYLVSATQIPTDSVIIWDISDGNYQPIARIDADYKHKLGAIGIHPDSQILVTGGDDGNLKLWNLPTGDALSDGLIHAHDAPIHALAFLPDTNILVSASSEHCVKLWDIESRICLATLEYKLPYEGLNLTGTTGLSEAQIQSIQSFGARISD